MADSYIFKKNQLTAKHLKANLLADFLRSAVYRGNTSIMILDEPTAALDPLAEAELYRSFAQITGNRTTLLISHRLGITKLVDRILVFRDGRIIEDGTHRELMEKKGYYSEMYHAQAAWYKTE